jgi:leucyl aminopeptidase
MDILIKHWTLEDASADAVGVMLCEKQEHPNALVRQAIDAGDVTGKQNGAFVITAYNKPGKRILVAGLGEDAKLSTEKVRRAAATIVQKARELRLRNIAIELPQLPNTRPTAGASALPALSDNNLADAIVQGAILADYDFAKHTDAEHKKHQHIAALTLAIGNRDIDKLTNVAERSSTIAQGVCFVRDLVNEGSDTIHPERIEEEARLISERHGLAMEVIVGEQLLAKKLNLMHAVGRASRHAPRLIILDYPGNPHSSERIALVGKTITFDMGGVNIKPAESMETMRDDMAGGATVLGAIDIAARLRLPVNIIAVLPVAENAVGPTAFRQGDVITGYNGKTVEIKHTDAEGRLILADALAYTIATRTPTHVIDLATLTGAALVCFGTHLIAMIGNNARLQQRVFDAGERSFERVWALPLYDEYKDDIKSDIADIKNLGDGRNAGTIAGAAFLSEFVGETPWVHLDIAGVAFMDKAGDGKPQGGTGIPLRLLVELLRNW